MKKIIKKKVERFQNKVKENTKKKIFRKIKKGKKELKILKERLRTEKKYKRKSKQLKN